MVGRDGIEPSTNGLKVHCSTAELTAHFYKVTPSREKRNYHSPRPLAGQGKGEGHIATMPIATEPSRGSCAAGLMNEGDMYREGREV